MDLRKLTVPVFRSNDAREVARATAILRDAAVPYRVEDAFENRGGDTLVGPVWGGGGARLLTHTIFVAPEHGDFALGVVADVPSEVIFADLRPTLPTSRLDRFMPWVLVVLAVATIVILVVGLLMGWNR